MYDVCVCVIVLVPSRGRMRFVICCRCLGRVNLQLDWNLEENRPLQNGSGYIILSGRPDGYGVLGWRMAMN